LAELGLEDTLLKQGAQNASNGAFFTRHCEGKPRPLPQPALCISRFVLDKVLADNFRGLGGILWERQRWTDAFAEGVVRGTGRRTRPVAGGWRWFGLKAHARNVSMTADLEMHLQSNGYIGLCRLSGGEVNVCGLFRTRSPEPDLARTWRHRLLGPENSPLRRRLSEAVFEEDAFCSVAGLMIEPQSAADHTECCIGDALTMIAPLTGNGMSMAFESAEIAIEPLAAYSSGGMNWEEARRAIAERCDSLFRRRLTWGCRLQDALLREGLGDALVRIGSRWEGLWRVLFRWTR